MWDLCFTRVSEPPFSDKKRLIKLALKDKSGVGIIVDYFIDYTVVSGM